MNILRHSKFPRYQAPEPRQPPSNPQFGATLSHGTRNSELKPPNQNM